MGCVLLTDASGRWFNRDTAVEYADRLDADGISLVTHDRYTHQCLYRTASGHWILRAWSQRDIDNRDQYGEISVLQAACWLLQNCYDVSPEVLMTAQALEL